MFVGKSHLEADIRQAGESSEVEVRLHDDVGSWEESDVITFEKEGIREQFEEAIRGFTIVKVNMSAVGMTKAQIQEEYDHARASGMDVPKQSSLMMFYFSDFETAYAAIKRIRQLPFVRSANFSYPLFGDVVTEHK